MPHLILVIFKGKNAKYWYHKVRRILNIQQGGMRSHRRTTFQEYPSHRDKKSWCFWGVLVRWNVGLRLETLRMPSYPCSPTSNSRACKQNHQSWMTHQTALQDETQGNMKICLTVGLAWTYCSMQWMLLSSRLLRMFLLQSILTSHCKKLGDSLTWLLQDCLSIPHLSWVGSMERWLAMLQASSDSVTCLGTDRNHMPGWFMNVRQYVLVNVQLVIWFQSSLSHETLATCTLLHPRKDCTQGKEHVSLHTGRS